jgi:hypothetical protein
MPSLINLISTNFQSLYFICFEFFFFSSMVLKVNWNLACFLDPLVKCHFLVMKKLPYWFNVNFLDLECCWKNLFIWKMIFTLVCSGHYLFFRQLWRQIIWLRVHCVLVSKMTLQKLLSLFTQFLWIIKQIES